MSEPLNMIKENIDTGYDCVDAKEAYNISDNRIDFFHEIGVITDDEKQKWKEYNSIKFNESK